MTFDPTRIATCQCDDLALMCSGDPSDVVLCHCVKCQKRTGSPFGVAAFYQRDQVSVNGPTSCYRTQSAEGFDFSYHFCPNCGSTVYWETSRKPGFVVVAVGAFADPDFPAPSKSVSNECGHPWLTLNL